MSAIVIDISNSKKDGLTEVKRTITVNLHVKDYSAQSYTVPYLLEHWNSNREKISLIPDMNYTLIADNIKRIWVGPGGATSRTFVANWTELGLFDFFQILQKSLTDVQILTAEITRLDGEGYFD